MGYKQIDGNKPFLINEHGQVRQELRNLPEDSDRFIFKRDSKGKKKNAWPKLILSADTGNGEDVRLIPEIMLKEHGELPRSLPCSAEDFEARDGNKLNTAKENIEYVGAGTAKAKPYKEPPVEDEDDEEEVEVEEEVTKESSPAAENKSKPVPPKPAKQVAKEAREAEKANIEDPELPPVPTPNVPNPEDEELKSDLQKGSGGLNAKQAIKVINDYDFEELRDAGFYTEDKIDNPRATVQDAWKAAEIKWKEEMKQ